MSLGGGKCGFRGVHLDAILTPAGADAAEGAWVGWLSAWRGAVPGHIKMLPPLPPVLGVLLYMLVYLRLTVVLLLYYCIGCSDLSNRGLTGSIPTELGRLDNLNYL